MECSASMLQSRRCKCPVGHGGKNGVVLWGGLPLFFTIGDCAGSVLGWAGQPRPFFYYRDWARLGLVPAFFYLYGSGQWARAASPIKKI